MTGDIKILTGDFRQLATDLVTGSVDAIVTDPPYPKEFLPLWGDLGRVAVRVLKPSGFLVAYSGHYWLDRVMIYLGQHLTYYSIIINAEPGAHAAIMARALFQEWKPVLIYTKEPVKRVHKWGSNVVVSPGPSKKHHKWGQSVEPCRELIERFTRPGDLVLDPFVGGGTTAVACLQTGRRFVGFEIDGATAQIARDRVKNAQLPLFVAGDKWQQLGIMSAGTE